MPKKIIKNCVFEFAAALCSELTKLGFCSISPSRSPDLTKALELSDAEVQDLDRAVKEWQIVRNAVGLTCKRFGDTVVRIDINVRKPIGGSYFYSVGRAFIHQPTNRLLCQFQGQLFQPLYPGTMGSCVSFSMRKEALPGDICRYLSQQTWEDHGSQLVDWWASAFKDDLLPDWERKAMLQDLSLGEMTFAEEGPESKGVRSLSRPSLNPEFSEIAWMYEPVLTNSQIIQLVLTGRPETVDAAMAIKVKWQERGEQTIPGEAELRKGGVSMIRRLEYVDAHFMEQIKHLVSTEPWLKNSK